jgi:translation initiation factor 1 (eIF-1/SUI1)
VLSLRIDDTIEKRFRKTIGELQGTHRGNLKAALEEAIFVWTQLYNNVYDISYKGDMQKELKGRRKGSKEFYEGVKEKVEIFKETAREGKLRSIIERLMKERKIENLGYEESE